MIGDIIKKARKEKKIKKTELSKMTNINIGHLTHIEKGERNPSHKALKNICAALKIPYMPLMFTYDKELNEEQKKYNAINYISYNKILAVDNIANFIDCPESVPNSAIAIKMNDDSMQPTFEKNKYLFVELNTPLSTKDIGIFYYNSKIIVRRFYSKKQKIMLKSDNKSFNTIRITDADDFYIIGKIVNT